MQTVRWRLHHQAFAGVLVQACWLTCKTGNLAQWCGPELLYSHFRFSEHVLLCVQHLIPEPCSEAYIAEVEEWMETPEVRSKEEVMADEFGEVAVAGPLAGEVCPHIKVPLSFVATRTFLLLHMYMQASISCPAGLPPTSTRRFTPPPSSPRLLKQSSEPT